MNNSSNLNRSLSMHEVIAFVSAWTVTIASFVGYETFGWIFVFVLPGPLLLGPIGFMVGGRRSIAPFAMFGCLLWWLVLATLPFIGAASE